MSTLSRSLCKPWRHVLLGRPRFLLPCGFHSRAWRTMVFSFLNVCTIHFYCLLLMITWIGSWPVRCHRSLLETFSGHQIPSICLKHLLKKTSTCFMMAAVSLLVSEPQRRMDLTLELNIHNLVLVQSARAATADWAQHCKSLFFYYCTNLKNIPRRDREGIWLLYRDSATAVTGATWTIQTNHKLQSRMKKTCWIPLKTDRFFVSILRFGFRCISGPGYSYRTVKHISFLQNCCAASAGKWNT